MSSKKLRWRPGRERLSETEALWQYLLDHTRPHKELGYVARFSFKNKESFQRSINARAAGLYRYSLEEIDLKNKQQLKRRSTNLKKKIKKFIRLILNKW